MYMYPDTDDLAVQHYVMTKEWHDCKLESIYLNKVITLLNRNDNNTLLDAGCGKGRLLPIFAPIFKKIVAIDPDSSRLSAAEESWQNMAIQHDCEIEFHKTLIQDFYSRLLFDCILCSHVLNHIKTSEINRVMLKFNSLLKKNGKLILLATNCKGEEDTYSLLNNKTGEEIIVSLSEFDQCIDSNDQHFLPTYLFTEKTLKTLLCNNGFEIIFSGKYHGYPKTRGDNFIFATKVGNI